METDKQAYNTISNIIFQGCWLRMNFDVLRLLYFSFIERRKIRFEIADSVVERHAMGWSLEFESRQGAKVFSPLQCSELKIKKIQEMYYFHVEAFLLRS